MRWWWWGGAEEGMRAMKRATPVLLAGEPREFVWSGGGGAERPVGVVIDDVDNDGEFVFEEASR